ncbi:hypothetical protein ACP_0270 [Acidobacterium capsulatum ATCC 51196]|uniref:Uncharacterized protein n=1 Tax=Acidobacterium capsulatum (strain ATCC 51196 / DSM 11244 / BCRC 80197 / JCM 7670 / NBRC 15755 / NCIMB 13165 / 161) TaxID=240015 RepID=C1F9B6_ACIC5|nr:hypothetical protein ACP_0270 [Acidobacterium capsulatum ATCC 51196]
MPSTNIAPKPRPEIFVCNKQGLRLAQPFYFAFNTISYSGRACTAASVSA